MLKKTKFNSKLRAIRLKSGNKRYEIFLIVSNANISSFLYDKFDKRIIKSVSTMSKNFTSNKNKKNKITAQKLGSEFLIILKSLSVDLNNVYFNKGEYTFHGVVKSFYDAVFNA